MKTYLISFICFSLPIAVFAQSYPDRNIVSEYFQNQQYEEAIGYLTPALIQDSNNLKVLGFLGYANYMNENFSKAQDYYIKIINLDSNNIAAMGYLLRMDDGKPLENTMTYARRLISLEPNRADHYRNMAELFLRTNTKDSVMLYYRQAYKLSPRNPKNAAGYASILISTKDMVKADSILKAGLERDSLNISYLKLSVRSAYESKNYHAAIVHGEKLIVLEEKSLAALTQLLLSYYNTKQYHDCIRICEYMFKNELDTESVYYYEARAYAQLKEFEKSNELLQICLTGSISKTAELYHYSLAENYEALKMYNKAVLHYDSAYYLFKDPMMMYNCGRICESNLHKEKLALKYYSVYLQHANLKTADEKKVYEYVKSKFIKETKAKK